MNVRTHASDEADGHKTFKKREKGEGERIRTKFILASQLHVTEVLSQHRKHSFVHGFS